MSGSGLGVGCKRVTQMPPPPRLQGGTHSGAWVQSLIRELGSHMLHSMVKKKKKKNQQICGRKGEREERREGGRIDTVPRGLAGVAGHEFSSFSQVVPCQ